MRHLLQFHDQANSTWLQARLLPGLCDESTPEQWASLVAAARLPYVQGADPDRIQLRNRSSDRKKVPLEHRGHELACQSRLQDCSGHTGTRAEC